MIIMTSSPAIMFMFDQFDNIRYTVFDPNRIACRGVIFWEQSNNYGIVPSPSPSAPCLPQTQQFPQSSQNPSPKHYRATNHCDKRERGAGCGSMEANNNLHNSSCSTQNRGRPRNYLFVYCVSSVPFKYILVVLGRRLKGIANGLPEKF